MQQVASYHQSLAPLIEQTVRALGSLPKEYQEAIVESAANAHIPESLESEDDVRQCGEQFWGNLSVNEAAAWEALLGKHDVVGTLMYYQVPLGIALKESGAAQNTLLIIALVIFYVLFFHKNDHSGSTASDKDKP